MRVLVDVATKEVPQYLGMEQTVVDSSGVPIMSGDDDVSTIRAEYLYAKCVDGDIHEAAVEDIEVARELKIMGISTTHII